MSEKIRTDEPIEKNVSFPDFFFFMFRKWKSLLLLIVLGVVVGIGAYSLLNALDARRAKTDEQIVIDINKGYKNMTINDVYAMKTAYMYRELYEKGLENYRSSFIMLFDPESVYEGILRYQVYAGDKANIVTGLLSSMKMDASFTQQLKDIIGVDCEDRYVLDLYSCGMSTSWASDQVVVLQNAGVSQDVPLEESNTFLPITISYSFLYSDQATCARALDAFRSKVQEIIAAYPDTFKGISVNEYFDTIYKIQPYSVMERQFEYTTSLNNKLADVVSRESKFSEVQMNFYTAAFLENDFAYDDLLAWFNAIPERRSLLMTVFIPTFLACVLWGFWYLLKYLMNDRVRYAKEPGQCYGLPMIGRFRCVNNKMKGLDAWRNRVVNAGMVTSDTEEYIAASLGCMDAKNILLCADASAPDNALLQYLRTNCPQYEIADFVQNDSAALEKAKKADGVVTLVHVGRTCHKQLKREMEIFALHRLRLIGFIAIDK